MKALPIVKIATTAAEMEMALRLRYDVFFLEGGDSRYADHARLFWRDQDDGPQSKLLIALDDSHSAVGTMRVTFLREWQFIGLDAYQLDVLASHIGIPLEKLRHRIARIDRGVVARDWRNRGVRSVLQHFAERIALEHACDVLVAVNAIDNSAARHANEKLGFQEYPVIGCHNGFTAQSIFKQLSPSH